VITSDLHSKKSNDIFRKIKNNIIAEGVISAIIVIVFPFIFLKEPIFFWLLLVIMFLAAAFGIKIYGKYLNDMKQLNESSLTVSLKKKLGILKRYVKQLNLYLLVFAPLGFALGFAFALKEEEISLIRIILIAGISLPFLGLMIWLGKKYIYALYGMHIKRIEEIFLNLNQD
jgi:hypothetical protein